MDAAVSVELFVEILNRYVYYFDQENEAVSLSISWICRATLTESRSLQSISMDSLSSSTPISNPMRTPPRLRTPSGIFSARWIISRVESMRV
jgi:hypothetical protein